MLDDDEYRMMSLEVSDSMIALIIHWLTLYAGLVAAGVSEEEQQLFGAPATGQRPAWREAMNCGPNSLYLLLRLKGRVVRYEEVVDELEIGERGCSIERLREVAARHGLRCAIVRCGIGELTKEHLPAVVHMVGQRNMPGHFMLLLGFDDEEVFVVDPMDAQVVRFQRSAFAFEWSGVALTPMTFRFATWHLAVIAFLLGICFVSLLRSWKRSELLEAQR